MLSDAKFVKCRKCGKPLGYVTDSKRFVTHVAASPEREISCYLHGMPPERKIITVNWLRKTERRNFQ
jgi:hypothetical protein